jgi:glycosyltransferase involved in cell wall biosynthesis
VGVQDAGDFFATVDILAVPSQWYEPFGRSAAEAALAGKRVLVSEIGGLPEAIDGYPSGKVVTNPASPAAWRDAILQVVGPGNMGTDVWAGPPDPAARYEALYRGLLKRPD